MRPRSVAWSTISGDVRDPDLLGGGSIIELDNGWRLTTARIAGDEVVELVLNGVHANRDEMRRYGLSEEIIDYKRRWFTVVEDASTLLIRLLAQRRPVRDVASVHGVPAAERGMMRDGFQGRG